MDSIKEKDLTKNKPRNMDNTMESTITSNITNNNSNDNNAKEPLPIKEINLITAQSSTYVMNK